MNLFWQQTMRPVRANIKGFSIMCFMLGTVIYFAGGITALSIAGLLNLAGFILIFFI
jgi:hypothetical protein